MNATVSLAVGVALVVIWVITALVIGTETGWVHATLAAGVVMIARSIILTDDQVV